MKCLKTVTKTIFALLVCLTIGCKTSTEKQNLEDEIKKTDSLKSTLIGKWGGPDMKSTAFEITKDSFIHINDKKSYKYELKNGNLLFQRGEYENNFINIHTSGDTLKFYQDMGDRTKLVLIKSWKVKE